MNRVSFLRSVRRSVGPGPPHPRHPAFMPFDGLAISFGHKDYAGPLKNLPWAKVLWLLPVVKVFTF